MTDPSARLDDIEARATFWHERAKQLNRELGAAESQLRAALAREQAVREAVERINVWATTVHGGTKSPADVWPGLRANLDAAIAAFDTEEQR